MAGKIDEDPHIVWDSEGRWWTDYPPPADFEGDEYGAYGDDQYRRTLAPAEQAVIDAEEADELALAEAQRDAWFFGDIQTEDAQPDANVACAQCGCR